LVNCSPSFTVFVDSGFQQTLCGGQWQRALTPSNGSTGRLGCCSPGTFMEHPNLNPFTKATACKFCPNGQYGSTVDDDITSCNRCIAGTYSSSGSQSCENCGTGKYGEKDGQTFESSACQKCGLGKYNDEFGQSGCKNCSTGKYGYYNEYDQSFESDACHNCPSGMYNDQVGQSSFDACENCAAGQFNDKLGSSNCSNITKVVPLPDGDGDSSLTGVEGTLRRVVSDWRTAAKKSTVVAMYGAIEDWNMSQVTNLAYVFSDFDNFNANISSWDVSNVNTLKYTFYNAYNFNSNISNWNTAAVTTLQSSTFNFYLGVLCSFSAPLTSLF
jgi:surface protein